MLICYIEYRSFCINSVSFVLKKKKRALIHHPRAKEKQLKKHSRLSPQLKSKNLKNSLPNRERLSPKTWPSSVPRKNSFLSEKSLRVCLLGLPWVALRLLHSVVWIHRVMDSQMMDKARGRMLRLGAGRSKIRESGEFSLRMENAGNFIQGSLASVFFVFVEN